MMLDRIKGWLFRGGGGTSISNRTIALDLDIGTVMSTSGERVSQDRSLTLDTVWACVRIISRTIGTLPLHMYRIDNSDFGVQDKGHHLSRILRNKPNTMMTASRFWESAAAHLSLRGNHFSKIFRNGDGRISSIIPFPYQNLVQVEETDTGELLYTYTGDTPQVFQAKEIFHLRGFSFDGRVGLSVIKFARQSFGNALAVANATGRVFGDGLQARGLISAVSELTNEQVMQVHSRIEEHRKRKNGNSVLVLPAPLKYDSLMMNPDDAQMLETRGFSVEEICRWFGVPPMLIGHMTKNTSWGSGIEQLNLHFLQYGLNAILGNIESEINNTLIPPHERENYYVKFNVEGLLRGDSKGRAEYLKTMVNGSLMTPNEARAKENLPPFEGGDDLIAPTNYAPLAMLGTLATRTAAPKGNSNEPEDA